MNIALFLAAVALTITAGSVAVAEFDRGSVWHGGLALVVALGGLLCMGLVLRSDTRGEQQRCRDGGGMVLRVHGGWTCVPWPR